MWWNTSHLGDGDRRIRKESWATRDPVSKRKGRREGNTDPEYKFILKRKKVDLNFHPLPLTPDRRKY